MSFSAEHASALADIRAAGADVDFVITAGTYTESTDVETSLVTTTVSGAAIRVKGTPQEFQAGGLTVSEKIVLLFAPNTYGARPALDSVGTWEGASRTVLKVSPVAIDGHDIISRVVVA